VPVKESEISDVKFHLDEARIYNKKLTNVVTVIRSNDTSGEVKATFSFTKKVEMATTWAKSGSLKIDVKAKFTPGKMIPIIGGAHVTVSTESTVSLAKTTCEKDMDETMITEEYNIPPRSKVAGKLVATRAYCDVPFSYKQTDILTTGEEVSTIHDDGIYTVANNYNFHIELTDNKDKIRKLGG
jgi:hypothetical protein